MLGGRVAVLAVSLLMRAVIRICWKVLWLATQYGWCIVAWFHRQYGAHKLVSPVMSLVGPGRYQAGRASQLNKPFWAHSFHLTATKLAAVRVLTVILAA